MNELVETIKKIGIFMIAAQAVLHFAPGQKYEKYIKLIVGTLILLQFVAPLCGILDRTGEEWGERLAEMGETFERSGQAGAADSPTASDAVIESLEDEIKSKLNTEISEETYVVSDVRVFMKALEEDGDRRYELEKVRVAVYQNAAEKAPDDRDTGEIRKIQIDKIDVDMYDKEKPGDALPDGEEASEGGESRLFYGETEELAEQLRTRFGNVLGLEEAVMEVSVYGAD